MNWISRRGGGQGRQPQAPPRYPGTPVVSQPRGFPPMRGRGNLPPQRGEARGRSRGQPQGRGGPRPINPPNAWAGQAWKIPQDVIMDFKILNIAQGSCYACGDISHGWNNHKCPYFGTQLFSKPCRNCLKGAHQHILCHGKKSGSQGKKKPQHTRVANIEEITGDPESFDWMLSESEN